MQQAHDIVMKATSRVARTNPSLERDKAKAVLRRTAFALDASACRPGVERTPVEAKNLFGSIA